MLGHDDVPNQPKLKFAPDLAQNFQKQISRANRFQVAPPVITAKSKEMQVSLAEVPFQTFRHNRTRRVAHPCKNRKVGHPRVFTASQK